MAWKGDTTNPAPNSVQLGSVMSDMNIGQNRAQNIRRDQDSEKDFTVKLIDIDTAIFDYLDKTMNISVVDNGENLKVPIFYASPEKWKSVQKDGVLRDQQGKLQLPAMVFKRTSFSKAQDLMTMNRHLTYPILKKFHEKNKYDKFSILNNSVAPTHQVFGVTLPDHINVTYDFTCWCEYIEQLNSIIQRINFSCEEYWGDPKRFKFRVYATDYSFTTESTSDKDRLVKSTFSLNVKAYLLEESFESRQKTVNRSLTPKVIKIGTEIVSSAQMDSINESLKETSYKKPFPYTSNGQALVPDGDVFEQPKISFEGATTDSSSEESVRISSFYKNLSTSIQSWAASSTSFTYADIWKPVPAASNSYGEEGWMSYDGNYHYIYVNGSWKRHSIAGGWVGF